MLELVIGGSGSGKSLYAEKRAKELCNEGGTLIYTATMKRGSVEAEKRIQKHCSQRAGMGFETIERTTDFLSLVVPKDSTVLLECMSNLLANEMFDVGGYYVKRIIMGIDRLRFGCSNLVIVTNDVFGDGIDYCKETERYRSELGELNRYYASEADRVVEVINSIPQLIKEKAGEDD